jgi:hypothetical protein
MNGGILWRAKDQRRATRDVAEAAAAGNVLGQNARDREANNESKYQRD